jgi:anaerobic ribonucleoside-triphosphate reductase
MVRIAWGDDQVPIYLGALHVLKARRLCSMEKIKDNEVWHAILDDLHIIMYMPIEPSDNIEAFMTCGKNKIIKNSTQHLSNDSWIQYF